MFPWQKKQREFREEVEALKGSVAIPVAELDVDNISPVLVPESFYFDGKWPGPFEMLMAPGLGLTWAVQFEGVQRYVSRADQEYWDSQGFDWRAKALENNNRVTAAGPYTHEKRDADGRLIWVGAMHIDGLGTIRLLAAEVFQKIFPAGYEVGLPEMSCGIAVSSNASSYEREEVEGMVENCHQMGTRPLITGLHKPEAIFTTKAGKKIV